MNDLITFFCHFFDPLTNVPKIEYHAGVLGNRSVGGKFVLIYDGRRHINLEITNKKFFDIFYYDGRLRYDE